MYLVTGHMSITLSYVVAGGRFNYLPGRWEKFIPGFTYFAYSNPRVLIYIRYIDVITFPSNLPSTGKSYLVLAFMYL